MAILLFVLVTPYRVKRGIGVQLRLLYLELEDLGTCLTCHWMALVSSLGLALLLFIRHPIG